MTARFVTLALLCAACGGSKAPTRQPTVAAWCEATLLALSERPETRADLETQAWAKVRSAELLEAQGVDISVVDKALAALPPDDRAAALRQMAEAEGALEACRPLLPP